MRNAAIGQMEILKFILGSSFLLCSLLFASFSILDGVHHMSTVEERWPRLYKKLMSRRAQVILLVVALVLFTDIFIERHSEKLRFESAETTKSTPTQDQAQTPVPTPSPRVATSTGDQSPAIAGDANSVQYGDGLEKKHPPQSATSTVR